MALESFYAAFQLIFNVSFGIFLVIVSRTCNSKEMDIGRAVIAGKVLEGEGFCILCSLTL